MPVDILLTVILTSVIQSIFGVGVLLFGTPLLLLAGYDFINVLIILLPISLAINCFQIIKHYPHKNKYQFYGWRISGFCGLEKFFSEHCSCP